jgi:amino-acid N-acetyltransferase
MSAVQLRRATNDDWPAISALLIRHRLPLDGAADHLARFIVADDGTRLAGVGGLEVYGTCALLRSLAVDEPGKGLGTRLVDALVVEARDAGVTELVLLTTTAGAFFPRFGFAAATRDDVPAAAHASAELTGACPSSALVMRLDIRRDEFS